jgi:hypothetical protein
LGGDQEGGKDEGFCIDAEFGHLMNTLAFVGGWYGID